MNEDHPHSDLPCSPADEAEAAPTDRGSASEDPSRPSTATPARPGTGTLTSTGEARRRFLLETGALTTGIAAAPYLEAQEITEATRRAAGATSITRARLNINGRDYELTLDPRVTLLDALREKVGLPGTKKGCDRGQCGACTVLVNGRRVNSCLTLALACDGYKVVTVEGLSRGEALHPMQQAFLSRDAFQCGYCTPGQICSAVALLDELRADTVSTVTPDVRKHSAITLKSASDDEIRERMSGNLCRCGAYVNIVTAIRDVGERSA